MHVSFFLLLTLFLSPFLSFSFTNPFFLLMYCVVCRHDGKITCTYSRRTVLIFSCDKGRKVRRLLLVALLSDYEGCIVTPASSGECVVSRI